MGRITGAHVAQLNTGMSDTPIRNFDVHGREAFYKVFSRTDRDGNPVDLSSAQLFIEIPSIDFRAAFQTIESDVFKRAIVIEREDVARLSPQGSPYALIDETGLPDVMLMGVLKLAGYVGEPGV